MIKTAVIDKHHKPPLHTHRRSAYHALHPLLVQRQHLRHGLLVVAHDAPFHAIAQIVVRHQDVNQPIEALADRVVLMQGAPFRQGGHFGKAGRHFGEHAAVAVCVAVAVPIAGGAAALLRSRRRRRRRSGQPQNGAHLGHVLRLGVRPGRLLIGQPLQLGDRTEHGAHRLPAGGQSALVLQRQRHALAQLRILVRLAVGGQAQALLVVGAAVGEEGEEEHVAAQHRVLGDDAQPTLQAASALLEQRVDHQLFGRQTWDEAVLLEWEGGTIIDGIELMCTQYDYEYLYFTGLYYGYILLNYVITEN